MVSYEDVRDHVTSLFIMLNKKTVILFRIESLVVLATLLFFAMFLMDFFRRIIHDSFMRAVFSVFDAVSDSIVLYLLGAMQAAPFKNQLFPVWALMLVNFRYSADYISGYGVPDRRGRRFTEWRNVFKLLGSAFLNSTRGSSFTRPLWSVWCLQIVRSGYRLLSHGLALGSVWHGGSSQLVAEHMRARYSDDDPSNSQVDPVTMKGYNYLVYGETRQRLKLKKPQYQYALSDDTLPRKIRPARCCCAAREDSTSCPKSSPLITLDKVWENCPIHQPHDEQKDLPLAFALSRLLRCRFEDVTLQRCVFKINRELVKNIIGGKVGTSDALRIMELQLAFVHDYFNTRYPMVFWSGHISLFITLFLSMLSIVAVCWLAMDIRRVYKPPNGELANLVKGFNVDMIITWAFILLMIAKELWEMVTYLLSDWTSLILVCQYVQRKCQRTIDMDTRLDRMLLWFSRAKIIDKRWHGYIDQYFFVQSYDDSPRYWNFVHNLTTGIIPKKDDGAELNSAIKVPEYVKKAVLEKLSTMVEEGPGSSLPSVIKTLSNNNLRKQLQNYKAYTTQPTSSHIILVWHIATSLCEMELATKHGVNLSNPGCLRSLLTWLTSCCSSKPYLMDFDEKEDDILSWFKNCCSSKSSEKLPDELREPYTVANSLSRYCAYLVVSKPDLIPDSFLVPKIVFRKTVESARDRFLKNCDSLESRYRKLKNKAEKPVKDSEKEDVLKQGAVLGKELLNLPTDEARWKILAGVWTELLIHIAPTWNAQAHRKCLSGGEFITHIWALLWHYGIQNSSLWPNEVAIGNNAPAAPQNNGVGNENNMDETEQSCADISNNQIEINIHGWDEIKGAQEHDTRNSRRGLRRMEETENIEIEEENPDTIVEDTKFQRGMAGWPNTKRE
ncbi:hypothetical protein CFC21_055367 [Triticum aestivum]|uniref:DUF4220 domain-containing protein n=2 Tax=Triticum aestivum TaxID=4565 RepID=A0A9R1GGK2_WHEAT|nr:hypothetical protein CFC21_055367 [Triticum aestivum]